MSLIKNIIYFYIITYLTIINFVFFDKIYEIYVFINQFTNPIFYTIVIISLFIFLLFTNDNNETYFDTIKRYIVILLIIYFVNYLYMIFIFIISCLVFHIISLFYLFK